MKAKAEDYTFTFRAFLVHLSYGLLKLNRCRHRIDCAGKLDESPIAGKFHYPTTVSRQRWLQSLLSMLTQSRQRATLVAPHQARVADNVGGQDRRQFALLTGHGN